MIQKIVGDNKLSAFTLPPLPETLPLAPLPLINDPVLRDRAFTHTSVYQVVRVTHDVETDKYPEILDYEKLEYVGDAIIGKTTRCPPTHRYRCLCGSTYT